MEVKRQQWLIWQLRRISYRYPIRSKAFGKARIERGQYKCAHCINIFSSKEVQLDHIVPVIDPRTGFTSWDSYINNLFCDADGWQVLCKPCHKIKTEIENKERKNARNGKKSISGPLRKKSIKKSKKKKTKR